MKSFCIVCFLFLRGRFLAALLRISTIFIFTAHEMDYAGSPVLAIISGMSAGSILCRHPFLVFKTLQFHVRKYSIKLKDIVMPCDLLCQVLALIKRIDANSPANIFPPYFPFPSNYIKKSIPEPGQSFFQADHGCQFISLLLHI